MRVQQHSSGRRSARKKIISLEGCGNQFYKNLAIWLIISLVGFLILTQFKKAPEDITIVRYNDFLHMLNEGHLSQTVSIKNNTITWYTSENKKFQTVVPPQNETVTAALNQLAAKVSSTMLTLEQITEQALQMITSAPTGLSSRGWGKMSPEEQDRAYFQALVDSAAYQWDVGAGGGYRVSPTGTSSPDTLNPGAAPETLTPSAGGSPVVIKLTMDGREIAEVVDRNLLYRYRLGTTG